MSTIDIKAARQRAEEARRLGRLTTSEPFRSEAYEIAKIELAQMGLLLAADVLVLAAEVERLRALPERGAGIDKVSALARVADRHVQCPAGSMARVYLDHVARDLAALPEAEHTLKQRAEYAEGKWLEAGAALAQREAQRFVAAVAGPNQSRAAEIEAEADRLDRDRGYDGREGIEAILTNIEGAAELGRDEQGDELRGTVLSVAAWSYVLLDRLAAPQPGDHVDEDGDGS